VATPETTLWLLQGRVPAGRAICGCLTTHLDTPCHTPLIISPKNESSVSDTKPSKDEKMVFVGPVQNFISENLTNLNETIVTQIGDDKNGSIFTETIAIVGDQPKQKPPNYGKYSNQR
jgi:hypothetical protein